MQTLCKGPLPLHYRLVLPKCRQAKFCSRPLGGTLLSPDAKQHSELSICGYCWAGTPPSPSATLIKRILLV